MKKTVDYALLESFPVDVLERIEVIKGPRSVPNGSNAFSAVVNLITRQAESIPARRGRTVYVGAEMSISRRLTSRVSGSV